MLKGKPLFLRIISFVLCLLLLLPHTVSAAEIQPYASNYLTAYSAYVYKADNEIQVWYEVMGTDDMDELGVLSIILYEVNRDGSLTRVKTFLHENYDTMLSYNDWFHCSHVSYQGSATKTYKAYVCIWAGKDGAGDTRYMWATE